MKDLYPLWVEYKALHVTESTMLRMQKDWKKYYEFSEIASKPIASLTKLEIDAWVHTQIRAHNMNKHKYGNFSLIILKTELRTIISASTIGDNRTVYCFVDLDSEIIS